MWLGYVRTDTFSDMCTLDNQIENLIDCGVPNCNISVDIEFEGVDHTPLLGELFAKLGPCDHLVVQHLGILGSTPRSIAANILAAANLDLDVQTLYPIPDHSVVHNGKENPLFTNRVSRAAMQVMTELFLYTNLSVYEISDLMKIPSRLLSSMESIHRQADFSGAANKARKTMVRNIAAKENQMDYGASVK